MEDSLHLWKEEIYPVRIHEERMETYSEREKFDGDVHWPLPNNEMRFD